MLVLVHCPKSILIDSDTKIRSGAASSDDMVGMKRDRVDSVLEVCKIYGSFIQRKPFKCI